MPKSVTCTKAAKIGDRLEVHFGNQTMDFEDVAAIGRFVDDAYDDNETLLQAMLLRWARKNGKWSDAKGKTITLNFNAPDGAIVKVT